MASFAQTNSNKFDSALAARVREFKEKQIEEHVAVIIRHESPQSDDELRRMIAAKKGKLKKHMASMNMSFAELPVSQLESLASESSVKRISIDASVRIPNQP